MRDDKKGGAAFLAVFSVGVLGMAGLVAAPTYAAVNCPDGSVAETMEACESSEGESNDEARLNPSTGEGINFTLLPDMDEELVKLPAYQEVVAPIANLDKTQALKAALKAVDEQIPDWKLWDETIYGMRYAEGLLRTWDPREGWGGDLGAYGMVNSIAALLYGDDATEEQLEQVENAIKQMAPAGELTMERAITYAKTLPQYASNAEFKATVDAMEVHVQKGAEILRKNLPLLDPSLTEDDLKDKTADELVALTAALPKYPAYRQLWNEYNGASVYSNERVIAAYSDTEEDRESFARGQTVAYGRLVLAARQILPIFAVDLSGVEQLPREEVPAELPKASAPVESVPDTGVLGNEGESANIVTVALLGVAAVATGAGAIHTAKRYLFSPLKRRRH